MDKNFFSLRGPAARRASTAVPVERPWNPPQRRVFSSREQRSTRENAEALSDFVDRIDDPPAYLRDDSRMHRPLSMPRFGALRIASQEGPDIEMDERVSLDQPQGETGDEDSQEGKITAESGSQGRRASDGSASSQEVPSFSNVQHFIDSLWVLNGAPEQLQDFFDGMKEELHGRVSELSTEKRTSAKFSRDIEALQREGNALQEKGKQHELQIAEQDEALRVHSEKCRSLREENEKLRMELQRDRQTFEKAQAAMKEELDMLSKDLEATKTDLLLKEKAHGQIQRKFMKLEHKTEDEVQRRESAELEAQDFKQDIFDLRKRSNDEKRNWLASTAENEAKIRELEELNYTLTAKAATLEQAVETHKESNEVVETDLLGVLSFVRCVCLVVLQVYQQLCGEGRRGLLINEVIGLPSAITMTTDEECEDYEVFEQLAEALDASSSAASVLELASAYKEAMIGFFRTLVLRVVAQSQFVCSSHDALTRIESTHAQLRESFQQEWHRIRDLSADLSSELPILQQRASNFTGVLERNVRKQEDERMKIREELINLERGRVAVKDTLKTCKKYLASETENLLKSKKKLWAEFQGFKKRLWKDVDERLGLYKEELQKAKLIIKNLDCATSTSARKLQEMESSLSDEIERLKTLLSQRDAQLKELSRSEAKLRKAKDELVRGSRQLATDGEEHKRRMIELTDEKEKLAKEKDHALERVAEAEHAVQQMSQKVAEALGAKQNALEALIQEKSTTEELRSKLAKVYDTTTLVEEIQVPAPEKANMPRKDDSYKREDRVTHTNADGGPAPRAVTPKRQNEKLRASPAAKDAATQLQTEENPASDLCYVDPVPKRAKRRPAIQKTRKSPRQKRARSNSTKTVANAIGVPTGDLEPKVVSKKPIPSQDVKPQTSSSSDTARDEEWDIDFVIGKNEE